jgi:hypothetical protein
MFYNPIKISSMGEEPGVIDHAGHSPLFTCSKRTPCSNIDKNNVDDPVIAWPRNSFRGGTAQTSLLRGYVVKLVTRHQKFG